MLWKLHHGKNFIGWVALDGDHFEHDRSKLWCVPLATRKPKYDANPSRGCAACRRNGEHYSYHTESLDFVYHYALILTRSDSNVFKRVGIGKVYESFWMPAYLPDWEKEDITLG